VSFDLALGYFTGLHWLAPDLAGSQLIRTALLVHVCDAICCGVLAASHGYRRALWTAVGFVFGVWAVAVLLVRANLHRFGNFTPSEG
jgi:hypothetical protein